MFAENTYQEILKATLAKRCSANSRYSLRAFARDLKISPGRLSEILNQKLGLSLKAAEDICRRLGFSEGETRHFCFMVSARDARSKLERQLAEKFLEESKAPANSARVNVELETFQVISEWYHLSILELFKTKSFQENPAWIGKRLGISSYEAEGALERLFHLGFLKKKGSGRLALVQDSLVTPNDVPSAAIRHFHHQVIDKALKSLDLQTVEERDISALTVAVAKKDIPEIKRRIREFRRGLNAFIEKSSSTKEEVYALSIQFFRLTHGGDL